MPTSVSTLDAIFKRRAIRAFAPVTIAAADRTQLLRAACAAPSSFNIQPYRFYWIESADTRRAAAALCLGQAPAATASALIVAVADIGSWRKTSDAYLEWMRTNGFSPDKIDEQRRKARHGVWFFLQGWFGIFGLLKWLALRAVHCWRIIGIVPVTRTGMFQWATKNAALACQNLMIAAEALELNTCPMEGFDDLRLSRLLRLSPRIHRIVMVIAVGKRSTEQSDTPQWRRPLETTVEVL